MNEKVKRIGILLLAAFIEVIVYIVLHEGGHSFIAILCGAKITNFSILGAYMSATGGEFTQFSSSLMKVAGMAFPLVISVIYMLFGFKKKKQGEFYRTFSMLFSLVPVMSLLAWVFVPIAYMRGDTTNNDDVIQFIAISGIHPVCVMIVSAILFLLLCFIAWKKGMIQIWIDLVLSNRKVEGTVILIINTLENKQGVNWLNEKLKSCGIEYEIVHTTNMDINNCIGCNYCWLKTPGICTIKDDYEGILKKIIQADQVWIVADTHFEFISYKD
ncbi:MAG: site-2 protease family protein [Roseburia sp.]